MPLYHVQDSDRPCWVVAASWNDALAQWRVLIAQENDISDESEPQGIAHICDNDDLIIYGVLQSGDVGG